MEGSMTTPVETVQNFYASITSGETERMVVLMAPEIEWISVVDFHIQHRGPEEVMERVFMPLMQEWESFSPAPSEFHVQGSTVVPLGRFACVHRTTHKRADLPYAHVWDIEDEKIERHRQYINTLALEQVRRSGDGGATV
jgi:ketosteroid isomerase-like protein